MRGEFFTALVMAEHFSAEANFKRQLCLCKMDGDVIMACDGRLRADRRATY